MPTFDALKRQLKTIFRHRRDNWGYEKNYSNRAKYQSWKNHYHPSIMPNCSNPPHYLLTINFWSTGGLNLKRGLQNPEGAGDFV